ncbi:uncharacterized protein LOC133289618 [Gastrolobium bilobum]|uniref:uncharacterized protein LOC133289618 n=1 Tax=Gastrolobium bilobum TaxID=150636 RepID=UPI002AB1EF5E|nr:uncharacterized protein LOC133289618 [Gastrolobium bilobum]
MVDKHQEGQASSSLEDIAGAEVSLGAAKREFGGALKSMVRNNNVDIIVLLEPRTQSGVCNKLLKILGFDSSAMEEAVGFAGGIWVMWHSKKVEVVVLSKTSQLIHCNVKIPSRGDFNEIAFTHEKKRGVRADPSKCAKFASVLEDCKVVDMGCDDSLFTWKGPKWANLDKKFKRLDRVVSNLGWRVIFEEARVSTLPRLLSDHNPLLIKLFEDARDSSSRLLIPDIKVWNKKVFGNIDRRKNSLISRIAKIQGDRELNDSDSLKRIEENCQSLLINVLREEELFWYQKSRQKWIVDGDRNTRFYHLRTVVRRSSNKIFRLRNDGGGWVSETNELKNLACNFFKALFTEDVKYKRWITSDNLWPALSSGDMDCLNKYPIEMEIKHIVFNMDSFKAPGIDGFPAIFYKKN